MPQALSLTNVNLAGILHGEQELIFHNPIPPEGTMTIEGTISDIFDKGKEKGALVIAQSEAKHSSGIKLFTARSTVFSRLDGGFGGDNPPTETFTFPDRDPDFVVDASPSENQPLIYRLSGDVFQLHVDPEFAKMAGFDKPIMHGLCTHGYACRALIEALVPSQPELARRMTCRFTKPLYPGMPLKTQIWKTEEGKAVWRVQNVDTNEIVIDRGKFEYGDIPKDEIRFDEQVAVITGAGAGLGRVYALELAKRGAKVVVNDLGGARDGSGDGSATPADEVVAEIEALGGQAVANYDNVATPEGGQSIIQTALDAFGGVDILINNAGILRDKSFLKMEPENWNAVLDVHLNGAYHVTRPAFTAMKAKGYGRIIMTTSAAGLYGNFGQTNYTAAKMALVGLMNTLKLEGQKYDIKVNTIAPVAASRLTEDVLPPDFYEKLKPEFVAPLVLVLASKDCSVSGNIYNAGMGFFNRAAIVTGPGTVISDGQNIPTPEQVASTWNDIAKLTPAKEYGQLNEQIGDLLTALTPKKDAPSESVSADVSVSDIFNTMVDSFNADAAAGVDVIFQFNISGAESGDWACVIKDQVCSIDSGVNDQAACTLKMADLDFLDMMTGKLPAMQAYTSGKLIIEGDIMKSQLIEKLFQI